MKRYLLALAFLGCIVGANWAIGRYGIVSVGFGLTAPAGVFFAGLSFTARDLLQDAAGRIAVVVIIIIGAVLSAALSNPVVVNGVVIATAQRVALASGIAFLVSELVDMAIYTPLRRRNWLAAVGLSNTVGAVVDSALFLSLAFGSLTYLEGNVVGKLWVTLLTVALLAPVRRRLR